MNNAVFVGLDWDLKLDWLDVVVNTSLKVRDRLVIFFDDMFCSGVKNWVIIKSLDENKVKSIIKSDDFQSMWEMFCSFNNLQLDWWWKCSSANIEAAYIIDKDKSIQELKSWETLWEDDYIYRLILLRNCNKIISYITVQ